MQLAAIDNMVWIVIGGTALMLLLVFAIIFFVIIHQRRVINYQLALKKISEEQQHKLMIAAIESEETERKRISAELHDEVGALLSTIKLYVSQIQPENLNNDSKRILLTQSKDLLDETVKTVRSISANLQPMIIADFGLESAIQNFCHKLNQSSALSVSLTVSGQLTRLKAEQELAIFRIIQELTNNILKHAHASHINFLLLQKNESIQVFIEHDGAGLSQEEFEQKLFRQQGLGLKNIQNRINILKGNIHFEKNTNLSNTISVQVPLIS